jgi:HEPN domain-containing protein
MKNFFINYTNTLPYSNIIDFINYEKLENKDNIEPPLYSKIESIQSLLLDRIESLKTQEEIAECLKQYLNKNYIDENSPLKEIQCGLPQDITDEDFFRRYPNTLNLSDLLDYLSGNVMIFENQESVNNYIQNIINDLLTITDPLTIYQEILATITE